MKDRLAELVCTASSPAHGSNIAREYIQARILGALQRAGAMIPLAFHGGTALRFLYAIPRYTEDLVFALEQSGAPYDFRGYLRSIESAMSAEGYTVGIKVGDQKTVHSALVRFPGLPYKLGLSPHQGETLAVKIEVDTSPPAGAGLATTVVRRHIPLQLQHHDQASLLAGNLHALLQRSCIKGRDLYDLLWYLSDPNWPAPNLILLNNALRQTGWKGQLLTAETWRANVAARLPGPRWVDVLADVTPFLEPSADSAILTLDNLLRLLNARQA